MGRPIVTISIDEEDVAALVAYAMKVYKEIKKASKKEDERERVREALEEVETTRTDAGAGFFTLDQICSRSETKRHKQRIGLLPWSRTKILKMVSEGTFPAPIKGVGLAYLWPKEVIHAYAARIMEGQA